MRIINEGRSSVVESPQGGCGRVDGNCRSGIVGARKEEKKRGSQETNKEEKRRIDLDLF